jgi:hypothetical protein
VESEPVNPEVSVLRLGLRADRGSQRRSELGKRRGIVSVQALRESSWISTPEELRRSRVDAHDRSLPGAMKVWDHVSSDLHQALERDLVGHPSEVD